MRRCLAALTPRHRLTATETAPPQAAPALWESRDCLAYHRCKWGAAGAADPLAACSRLPPPYPGGGRRRCGSSTPRLRLNHDHVGRGLLTAGEGGVVACGADLLGRGGVASRAKVCVSARAAFGRLSSLGGCRWPGRLDRRRLPPPGFAHLCRLLALLGAALAGFLRCLRVLAQLFFGALGTTSAPFLQGWSV